MTERASWDRVPVVLEVSDLRTQFDTPTGSVRAVDGVSLTVRRGEVVTVVGESGCGKSATAQSIMRLVRPPGRIVGGSVQLGGTELLSLTGPQMAPVRDGRIAMLFQHPQATLDPTCRVGEHVAEPLRLHRGMGRTEAWERAVELLNLVGIPEPARRARAYPHQLSGGMAQRVMIASALSCEPELLIADEPTTALDVTVQAQILLLLKRLCAHLGLAVLLITHDLGVMAALASRVYVMYAGRVVEEGSVEAILREPRHPYTQALLRCWLTADTPHGQLFAIKGSVPTVAEEASLCTFAPRCHAREACHELNCRAHSRCESEEPDLIDLSEGRRVRCWAEAATP